MLTVDFQYSDIVVRPEDDLSDENRITRTLYSCGTRFLKMLEAECSCEFKT